MRDFGKFYEWLYRAFPLQCPFDGVSSFAPTGERYITVTHDQWDKPEGGPTDFVKSKEEAIERYHETFKRGSSNICGTVYWRKRPRVEEVDGSWRVYSRLLISDAPLFELFITGEITTMELREKDNA